MKFKASRTQKLLYVKDWNLHEFFFCQKKKSLMADFLCQATPASDPEELLKGRGHAFDFDWRWRPDEPCWHIAPDTGRLWARQFYSDIPHGPGNPYGDVRVIWEPNRLQHLVELGLYYYNNKDRRSGAAEDAAGLVVGQIRSWWEQNPPFIGVHYKSVMECGLRILSLCHAMDLIRESAQADNEIWKIFLNIVYSHAKIISSRLSLYSSLGNHTVAECAGLIYAGLLLPEFSESQAWTDRAMKLLEAEAGHQVLPDGGSAEQSLWYLRFILDLYGCVINLLHVQGRDVPCSVKAAWERGVAFLDHFEFLEGSIADIGDRDDGWALIPYSRAASLFQKSRALRNGARTFQDSGYTIYDLHYYKTIFNHGPLGMAPCYGHGHADCLSVQLYFKQSPVLIDPGTWCYNCEPEWRSYFRSTTAHNTVVVDGFDQAEQQTPFIWAEPYKADLLYVSEWDGGLLAVAVHHGYKRLAGPVEHLRGIVMRADGLFLVWDLLKGTDSHNIALNWHIGTDWDLLEGGPGGLMLQKGDCRLKMEVRGAIIKAVRGQVAPILGWASDMYGRKFPINTLNCAYEGGLPHEFMTIISPAGINTGEKEWNSYVNRMREVVDAIGGTPQADTNQRTSCPLMSYGR